MKRSKFLKSSALGLAGLSLLKTEAVKAKAIQANIEQVGFNHLPNAKNKIMNNSILIKADSRGKADHGWLKANHSFSFANYYNPERMHFGVLRVLNDDFIAPGKGFGTHPHENMEIITIPLEGDLEHKDSIGHAEVIKMGDVQVMSAGTGVSHSEYNANKDKPVKLFQIWLFPNTKNVEPRYDQITLDVKKMENSLMQILSPFKEDEGVWIHQNAWFHMGRFDEGKKFSHALNDAKNNGLYAMVIDGKYKINGTELSSRDALGIWDTETVEFETITTGRILLMEVPMQLA
jgi:redox-sensitive bicupin YhaK (pirin superfamily)